MKRAVSTIIILLFFNLTVVGQSYVDSGIQHYIKQEYKEALLDFDQALGMKELLTESSIGKMHYYIGMTWLNIAEAGKPEIKEKDAVQETYNHLTVVEDYSNDWTDQVADGYRRLSDVMLEIIDGLTKDVKKTDDLEASLEVQDEMIGYWKKIVAMDAVYGSKLELAKANKAAGDLIFESTTDFKLMMRAKAYYENALPLYEEARYDDPFSKAIISDMLTLAQRLADQERIEEYEKLLELAGG